jgi:CDGSH-type Zn-finger protein
MKAILPCALSFILHPSAFVLAFHAWRLVPRHFLEYHAPPMANVLQPQVDGPLKIEGEVEIFSADGALLKKSAQVWLCRCGKSANKPFCDGAHKKLPFVDLAQVSGAYQSKSQDAGSPGPTLKITLRPNGPIRCFGQMNIQNGAGHGSWTGTQASLCRCGGSKNKPFCDGSHRDIGFEAA